MKESFDVGMVMWQEARVRVSRFFHWSQAIWSVMSPKISGLCWLTLT